MSMTGSKRNMRSPSSMTKSFGHQILVVFLALMHTLRHCGWTRRITACGSRHYFVTEAFAVPPDSGYFPRSFWIKPLMYDVSSASTANYLSISESSIEESGAQEELSKRRHVNQCYISTLENNLQRILDEWIMNGNLDLQERVENIYQLIRREAMDQEQVKRVERLIARSGMTIAEAKAVPSDDSNLWKGTMESRVEFAQNRQQWEESFRSQTSQQPEATLPSRFSKDSSRKETRGDTTMNFSSNTNNRLDTEWDRMLAVLQRYYRDNFHSNVPINYSAHPKLSKWVEDQKVAYKSRSLTTKQISALEALQFSWESARDDDALNNNTLVEHKTKDASAKTSEMVAKAGGGDIFTGEYLGIGGLDDVLLQIKRRIWVPLAAPPSLLNELGINPVRGLLLYGMPGCGKTLLAKKLGQILSPVRPITIVSGPELMDKFVGASEANLRAIFDNPPDIYPHIQEALDEEELESISKAALHVVVMDEMDAISRQRGKKDQGDAGVARDSVVNQLLAKMDGVDELVVPTLVIGLTNRRSLIEPALLRPGRFEVQIEIQPPRTVRQRVSILKVHTARMFQAGRMLVSDAPEGTAASMRLQKNGSTGVPSYKDLLEKLGTQCDGMSGAMLAGVCRAAASRALERAVFDFASGQSLTTNESNITFAEGASIADCLITEADFHEAMLDVYESCKKGDGEDEPSFDSDRYPEPDAITAKK